MPERAPDGVVPTSDVDAPVAVVAEAAGAEEAQGGQDAPVEASVVPTTAVPRPRGDVVALAAAALLPPAGVLIALAARTWLTVAFLMLVPVVVAVYALGLVLFVRVLRRRSTLRRALGTVPARYRVYAWLWAVTFLLATAAPLLGGLDLPWALQAGLVGLSLVVVGVVTGAAWSTYAHDAASVGSAREA